MMCIIRDGDGEKVSDNGNKRKKKILKDFVEESAVKLTKIQPKTLNPEWNQTFKLYVLPHPSLFLNTSILCTKVCLR